MLSFATEFPLKSGTADEVAHCVAVWLNGSPHRSFSIDDIERVTRREIHFLETDTQSLTLIEIPGDHTKHAIGARHTAVDMGIIFSTTIVSREIDGIPWVSIRTDRASLDPQISVSPARKPQIVKTLIRELGGGLDGELWIKDTPHILSESDESMVIRLLNGDSTNYLPVVYVSRTFHNEVICDPQALARHLGGLAHIVVEPSRAFSRTIQPFTNSRNAYGGAVGIYLPTGKRSLLVPEGEADWEIRNNISSLVKEILLNRLPIKGLSWPDLEAERSRINIEDLKSSGSTDLDAFIREFDAENNALIEQNEALTHELKRLKNEIQKNNSQSPANENRSNHRKVQDYYDGESEHFLKEAIEHALSQTLEGSRRHFVLQEFIEGLRNTEEVSNRKKKLKETLFDVKSLDSKTERALRDLGFHIETDRRHHKLIYYGDERLTFTMAKTPSDWRAGKNFASDIAKKIY